MPPTIQALLAARLDRLDGERARDPRARRGDRPGVLAGRGRGALARVDAGAGLGPPPGADPQGADPAGRSAVRRRGPVLASRHILIRDAAYEAMLKEARAELHERFATWLEQRSGDAARRVRGDPRLPPRAGARVSRGARERRRRGARACGQGRALSRRTRAAAHTRAATCRRRSSCSSAPSRSIPRRMRSAFRSSSSSVMPCSRSPSSTAPRRCCRASPRRRPRSASAASSCAPGSRAPTWAPTRPRKADSTTCGS